MKKYISFGVMVALLTLPVAASAQTVSSLQAQLQTLEAEIAALQAQGGGSASGMVNTSNNPETCINLAFAGGVGTTGNQVSSLQTFLGINPATGYFGTKTQAALTAWQSAHGISPTGYFGPLTRAAMACGSGATGTSSSLLSNGISSAQSQTYTNTQYGFSFQYPSGFSIAPATVANGAKVTATGPQLYGSQFPAPSVLIEASVDPNTVSTCNSEDLGSLISLGASSLASLGVTITPTLGTQRIDGVTFRSASASADVEGSFLQLGFYAALNNGVCYVVATGVEGKDPSTQGQLQSASPVILPAAAANITAEENTILQSLTFSTPAASASQTTTSTSLSQATTALQDAERKSDLNAIQVDLELYYSENGKYPIMLSAMQSGITSAQNFYDPATFQPFNYQTDAAGDSYTLCATLSSGSPYCVQSQNAASVSTTPASVSEEATINTNTLTTTSLTPTLIGTVEGAQVLGIIVVQNDGTLASMLPATYPPAASATNIAWNGAIGSGFLNTQLSNGSWSVTIENANGSSVLQAGTYMVGIYDGHTGTLLRAGTLTVE